MALPGAVLNTLLFRRASRVRLALSALRLVRPLLFPSLLLPAILILLSCMFLPAGLVMSLLFLWVLGPAVLIMPLLWPGVVRPVALFMLRFRFGLLVLVLLLFVPILLVALLVMLGISRSRNSDDQRQNACAGDSN